jgi:Phosphate-selective porin
MRPKSAYTPILLASFAMSAVFAPEAWAISNQETQAIILQQQEKIRQLEERLNRIEGQSKEASDKADAAAAAAGEAKEAAKEADSGVDIDWSRGPSPVIKSSDGKNSFHVNGRIWEDYTYLRASDNPSGNRFNTNASQLRSLRLGVDGKWLGEFNYKFDLDFANSTELKDGYIDYVGPFVAPAYIRVGQWKTPNSLEQVSNTNVATQMEPASFIGASRGNGFGLDYQMGIGAAIEEKTYSGEFGIFSQNARSATVAKSGGYTVAARGTHAFNLGSEEEKDKFVHVGGSVRWRDLNDQVDDDSVRYRARPFFYDTNRSVDTGTINQVNGDLFVGPEFAFVWGPFAIQAEAAWQYVDLDGGKADRDDATELWGGYIDFSYFLTGESRRYRGGAFRAMHKVNRPVTQGGPGAIQLAARADYLDLNDGGADIKGGEQLLGIFAVNWYPVDYLRFSVNYAHTSVFNAGGVPTVNGSQNEINGVAGRASIFF